MIDVIARPFSGRSNLKRDCFGRAMLVLAMTYTFMSGCTPSNSANEVCCNNHCIEVEIAATDEDRMRGLQSRPSLDPDKGMLFVFPSPGKHSFWMKNTLIPLDIIWLDYARRVVYIEENAKPCKITPCPGYVPPEDALYVLEINGNSASVWGIKKGSVLEFRLKDLVSLPRKRESKPGSPPARG